MWTLSCSSARTDGERNSLFFCASGLLDQTKEAYCGCWGLWGIKGTKWGEERHKTRAKESGWIATHVAEVLKSWSFSPVRTGLQCRRIKVKFSFLISVSFTVSPQLSLGPTDWWIGLSIGQLGDEVRCVCFGACWVFPVAATDCITAVHTWA